MKRAGTEQTEQIREQNGQGIPEENVQRENTRAAAETDPQEMSIEEAFSALQELLGQMESGEIPLEESFALYERGMRLVQYCNTRIDRVEKQVQQISEEGTLEPFV